MKLSHFFIPHPETHKKAHLLSLPALLIYVLLFFTLNLGINTLNVISPSILGISTAISQPELIRLTNIQREKNGLSSLSEDPRLSEAALKKGENMFEENYWAHYSPSGKDPWGFIQRAGYKYTYAGENLAKNFSNPEDVVNAWMASPTHRDNLLNSRYKNVGMAVLEGELNGQHTILVVQEFGTPVEGFVAQTSPVNSVASPVKSVSTPIPSVTVVTEANIEEGTRTLPARDILIAPSRQQITLDPVIDQNFLLKTFGLTLISFLIILLIVDLYIIRRRAVVRIAARHWPHLALMSVAASALFNSVPGQIL